MQTVDVIQDAEECSRSSGACSVEHFEVCSFCSVGSNHQDRKNTSPEAMPPVFGRLFNLYAGFLRVIILQWMSGAQARYVFVYVVLRSRCFPTGHGVTANLR